MQESEFRKKLEFLHDKEVKDYSKLNKIVAENFQPVFEFVNEVFLDNEGEVLLSEIERRNGSVGESGPSYDPQEACVSLCLKWNDGYKQLRLDLTYDMIINLSGEGIGESSTYRFSFENEDWEIQLKERIVDILNSPPSVSEEQEEIVGFIRE